MRDATEAMALQIAYQRLLALGHRFSTPDIGKKAREILNALDGYSSDEMNEVKK